MSREQECTERTWCTMTDPDEHADYHAGGLVDLANGWWCWAVQDRGREPVIWFEREQPTMTFRVPAGQVAAIAWAIGAPSGAEALTELLAVLGQGQP